MSEYKISAPLRNLITFTGSDGKPVLVIDGEKRRIEVRRIPPLVESAAGEALTGDPSLELKAL